MEPDLMEDERHVLAICPAYYHLRSELINKYTIEVLQAWDSRLPTLLVGCPGYRGPWIAYQGYLLVAKVDY
jgi:hypothetical protein